MYKQTLALYKEACKINGIECSDKVLKSVVSEDVWNRYTKKIKSQKWLGI